MPRYLTVQRTSTSDMDTGSNTFVSYLIEFHFFFSRVFLPARRAICLFIHALTTHTTRKTLLFPPPFHTQHTTQHTSFARANALSIRQDSYRSSQTFVPGDAFSVVRAPFRSARAWRHARFALLLEESRRFGARRVVLRRPVEAVRCVHNAVAFERYPFAHTRAHTSDDCARALLHSSLSLCASCTLLLCLSRRS